MATTNHMEGAVMEAVSEQRIQAALGAALDAFWATVAKSFPEITTGDVPFDDPYVDQGQEAIERWYANNDPRIGHDYVTGEGETFAGAPIAPGTLMRWDASADTHYPAGPNRDWIAERNA